MMRCQLPLLLLLCIAGCDNGGNRAQLDRIAEVYDRGDTKTAIRQLDAYLKKYPRDDLAWTILGNAHEDEDNDEKAQSAYDKALDINPKRFEAITGLGVLHRKRGDYDAAMQAYQRALQIDPNYAQAYSSMTVIALKRQQDAQALEYASKGYELDNTDAVIAANLAVAYHYNGDFANRDKLTEIAENLGYARVDTLQQIYDGEISIRD